MAEFVNDTFTETSDTNLGSHTGETGASWNKNNWNTTVNNAKVDAASDTLINTVDNFEHWYASGTPAGAEYDVEADFIIQSTVNFRQAAIQGRMATTTGDFYQAELDPNEDKLYLRKYQSGTPTELGQYTYSGTTATYAVKLEIRNATKKAFLDGTERISHSNNDITADGKAGLFIRNVTNSAGPALDNFKATDAAGGPIVLVIQDATHAHSADNIVLTQQNTLVVQDGAHAHAADNVVLTGVGVDLIIQDGVHAHSADNLELIQANVLTIQDSTHAHLSDNLVLTQQNQLVIADALHAHTAENVTLSLSTLLVTQDATHAHTADNIALTQANVLIIQEALHALSSDNVDLTQASTLIIDDALHALISDNVTLTIPSGAVTPRRRTFIIQHDNRTFVVMADNRTKMIH
jgi:hypothetical protein